MHSASYNSPTQLIARLVAKRDHADKRVNTKPAQRRRKAERREYRQEIALCVWGAAAMSHSVEL